MEYSLIHAGIKINPCYLKGPQIRDANLDELSHKSRDHAHALSALPRDPVDVHYFRP